MAVNEALVKGVIQRLESLLGDGAMALTSENFVISRSVIEDIIFPAAESLEIDIRDIEEDYNLELMQSLGAPLSAGRLGYIKGHLRKLLERLNKAIEK